jgi:hypothetical protein
MLGFFVVATVGLVVGGASGLELAKGRAVGRPSHVRATEPRPRAAVTELSVPRATSEIHVDGELDDAAWNESAARTGAFVTGADVARPYSDARLAWRDGVLYVALYAADEDIVAPTMTHDAPLWTGDSFHLVFRRGALERSIDVSPRGVMTDGERNGGGNFDARWESRARIAVDSDGTVDDSKDEDEEWIVEMAIPLKELGLADAAGERIGLEISRCDRVRGADGSVRRACGTWGDARSELVLR